MRVGIVGLGYVGLPLAAAFLEAGCDVWGYDTDTEKTRNIRKGQSPIQGVPMESIVELYTTSEIEDLEKCEAIIVCVPTPLTDTREPDLDCIIGAMCSIMSNLQDGQLVVLESTTYPGTTRDVVKPILDESVNVEYCLAYSPEREDPGNGEYDLQTTPKVVGGIDEESLRRAKELYRKICDFVVPVDSLEIAEASKLLENTYRSVNIAMVNELKVVFHAMGIDIWKVIEAAKTKPFGFQAFYPGPGLGGHCIPIDPFYLAWIAKKHQQPTRFIELAGEINASMPQYVVDRIAEALNDAGKPIKGSDIMLLGTAYKPDIADTRESPAFPIAKMLLDRGALLSHHDPHATEDPPGSCRKTYTNDLVIYDCVVLLTDHSAFDPDMIAECSRIVVDTRGFIPGAIQA